MDLHDFLQQFISLDMAHVAAVALVVGGAVFALIEIIDGLVKRAGHPLGLSPDAKFWGAVGLSLAIPFAAYLIDNATQRVPITLNGVFLAAAVGFTTATAVHWLTGGSSNAKQAQAVFATGVNPKPPTPPVQ